MTIMRRSNLVKVVVLLVEVVLIAIVLLYLAEYFELPIFREAGGRLV